MIDPLHSTPRDHARPTYGGAVARLAAAMGVPPMPWQRHVLDVALELDERGRYRHNVIVLTVPRQSGKTTLLGPVMAHRMLTVPRARVWLTAQLRADARDTWGALSDLIETSPLARMTKRRNANGQEQLTLGGSTLRPFNAGDERSLHGKQSDLVFIDEAFAFSREQGAQILQAVTPTMATRPGAQTWVVSTAGTASSTWLRDWVDRGREQCAAGASSRLAYFEWGIPESCEDLADLDVYVRHHPAVGHTIEREALEIARDTMASPAEFARAYGNYWTSSAEWAIAPELWDRQRAHGDDDGARLDTSRPLALAAEVAADRSGAVIVGAGHRKDGRGFAVEVIEARAGIGWVAPEILRITGRRRPVAVCVDATSPAGSVHRALAEQRKQYVPLVDITAGTLVDAQTELMDGLVAGTVWHRSSDRLDAAVRAVTTRSLRETVVFSRLVAADGTSPAPLMAAMLALYGLAHPAVPGTPSLHVVGENA